MGKIEEGKDRGGREEKERPCDNQEIGMFVSPKVLNS